MEFDYAIIGGGIFGVYTALYLAENNNHKVCLIEKEMHLMKKATIVNQARLHCGYHYPRSIITAQMSNEHRARFAFDHKDFINKTFKQYYAIAKHSSFTSSKRFEAFCAYLDIKCENIDVPNFINSSSIDSIYLTEEFSFDPIEIAKYYSQKINENNNITVLKGHYLSNVDMKNEKWVLYLDNLDNESKTVLSFNAINATYFNINHVNKLFGQEQLDIVNELTEMVFFSCKQLNNVGLTVMDGPFVGFMPYGISGINSLYSVLYSVHSKSNQYPNFGCQRINTDCTPTKTAICNRCLAQPKSNYKKMFQQINRFIDQELYIFYLQSMYTIRTKLKSSFIDDGRPTSIIKTSSNPGYSSLLAGKINAMYEVRKFFE